jgi:hypothetical protein
MEKKKKGIEEEVSLCQECLLCPCIVEGKWIDLMDFCKDIMVFENDGSEAMCTKLMNHAESLMVGIFGAKYVANGVAPGCVHDLVRNYHSVKSGMELEGFDDDPDDDLVANATDRGEYLLFEANH